MRALFTTDIPADMDRHERHDALEALSNALRNEFPAYWISEIVVTDFVAVLVVESRHVAALEGPAPRPAHLNGWGHGDLTMKLVA